MRGGDARHVGQRDQHRLGIACPRAIDPHPHRRCHVAVRGIVVQYREPMRGIIDRAAVNDDDPLAERHVLQCDRDVQPQRAREELLLQLVARSEPVGASGGQQDQDGIFNGDH